MLDGHFLEKAILLETEDSLKHFKIKSGIPQNSVLRPTLWNVLYCRTHEPGLNKCRTNNESIEQPHAKQRKNYIEYCSLTNSIRSASVVHIHSK